MNIVINDIVVGMWLFLTGMLLIWIIVFPPSPSRAFSEPDYEKRFTEDCLYMHDVLHFNIPINVCVHVLAFRMAHINDIEDNAHVWSKPK